MSSETLRIEEVTDETVVPELAGLFDIALQPDSFHECVKRYGIKSLYDDAVDKLTTAVSDPDQHVFKAILSKMDDNGVLREELVGLTNWYVGYVKIPKTDPFAVRPAAEEAPEISEVAAVATNKGCGLANGVIVSNEAPRSSPSNALAENSRRAGNAYITAIRGKRHIYLRRMIVHPAHQRKGIGQRLIQWGVDLADRENIVAWLLARPAGSKLYERNGWNTFESLPIEVPDMQVDPMIAMLRPRPRN